MTEYLYIEITKIVNTLFCRLSLYKINIESTKNELSNEKKEMYSKIYKEFEDELINLKNKTILKYGNIQNFDYLFGLIVQNIVISKQKLLNENSDIAENIWFKNDKELHDE